MLELSYHTKYTQEEAIAMDYPNNNTKHEKGKHLKYEDYVVIQVRLRDGRKANRIAKELGCAANTVRNIIRKGMTPLCITERYCTLKHKPRGRNMRPTGRTAGGK